MKHHIHTNAFMHTFAFRICASTPNTPYFSLLPMALHSTMGILNSQPNPAKPEQYSPILDVPSPSLSTTYIWTPQMRPYATSCAPVRPNRTTYCVHPHDTSHALVCAGHTARSQCRRLTLCMHVSSTRRSNMAVVGGLLFIVAETTEHSKRIFQAGLPSLDDVHKTGNWLQVRKRPPLDRGSLFFLCDPPLPPQRH